MEPELEAMAGDWPADDRKSMAKKLKRWAKQLEFSAIILEIDASPGGGRRPAELRYLAKRFLSQN